MAKMASLVKRCARCLVGGITISTAWDGRPMFTCTRCGHQWTEGK